MAIVIIGDLDWTGDLVLFLEALDGGPAADVAGYAFTSSGDIEYSCSIPEPLLPANRLLGTYRCVAKTVGGVLAGVGYVTIASATAEVRIRAEQAVGLDSSALALINAASSSPGLLVSTTIVSVTSQTVFILANGAPNDDVYNNQLLVVTDAITDIQKSCSIVSDYVASTKTVTIRTSPKFTIAPSDKVSIIGIGDGLSQAVNLFLGAAIPLNVGQVSGLDQELVVGDSYTAEVGRRIPVSLVDASGDAVSTQFGNRSLADNNCTIRMLLHDASDKSVRARAVGQCEFVPVSGQTPASLLVSLSHTETGKLSPAKHIVQFRAEWPDGVNVTLAWKGTVTFKNRVSSN